MSPAIYASIRSCAGLDQPEPVRRQSIVVHVLALALRLNQLRRTEQGKMMADRGLALRSKIVAEFVTLRAPWLRINRILSLVASAAFLSLSTAPLTAPSPGSLGTKTQLGSSSSGDSLQTPQSSSKSTGGSRRAGTEASHWKGYSLSPDFPLSSGEGAWPELFIVSASLAAITSSIRQRAPSAGRGTRAGFSARGGGPGSSRP